jgi:lipopolysaccharide transport system permease protein
MFKFLKDIQAPPVQLVIEPNRSWFNLKLETVWRYRELLYFLILRDIKVRYKQTILGVTWVVIQPVVSMLVYSGLFGVLLQVPTGGLPYPLFVLTGLLPWQYFTNALTKSTNSVVDNASLVSKIYFPRLIIPLAGVLSNLVDFFVSAIVLAFFLLAYRVSPTPAVVWLPFFLLLAILTAFGFGLWLSALNVRYRDVRHLIPFVVQIWMYLTPVVYGAALIPERFRWLLGLNPMSGVVEGFRWALVGSKSSQTGAPGPLFAISIFMTIVVLVTGLVFYRKVERTFADVI